VLDRSQRLACEASATLRLVNGGASALTESRNDVWRGSLDAAHNNVLVGTSWHVTKTVSTKACA
jgi:hypothetical protein